ncbi:MAG: M48 family metalloprotease [Bacteroidota bacterium]
MKKIYFLFLMLSAAVMMDAQKLKTTQPTNYLREGPGSYFQIVASLPVSAEVNKVEQKGSWLKVKTEQNDLGWLSENSFVNKSGKGARDENIIKGKTSSRASRAELAAAVKGFGKKYVEGSDAGGAEISKYSEPIVTPGDMDQFEHSFTIEPFRGYMSVEKPFDIQFHEEGIGLGIALKIVSQKGLVNDRVATLYVNLIGNYLSKYTKAYDLGFRFFILNDDHAAAYSVPGGYIFITKGMFRACANEAELASVIAHEMVHVIQRHGVKELKKSEAKIKSESAFAELEEDTGPMGDEEKDLEEYANNVYQNLISPRLLSYETDADKLAMVYLKRAGYDPTALSSVLQKIYEPSGTALDIFDDNYMKKDDMRERLLKVQKTVRDEGYRSRSDRQFSERFLQYTAGIR